MEDELLYHPDALHSVWLSVIAFGSFARQATPLAELGAFFCPDLRTGGTTSLGAALSLLMECIRKEDEADSFQRGGQRRLIFLVLATEPDDEWAKQADAFRNARLGNTIACGLGPNADLRVLKQITDHVIATPDYSEETFERFFRWTSRCITTVAENLSKNDNQAVRLPQWEGSELPIEFQLG